MKTNAAASLTPALRRHGGTVAVHAARGRLRPATDKAVRGQAEQFQTSLAPAEVQDPQVNSYLQQIGQRIVQSGRDLDAEHIGPEVALRQEGERELDVQRHPVPPGQQQDAERLHDRRQPRLHLQPAPAALRKRGPAGGGDVARVRAHLLPPRAGGEQPAVDVGFAGAAARWGGVLGRRQGARCGIRAARGGGRCARRADRGGALHTC